MTPKLLATLQMLMDGSPWPCELALGMCTAKLLVLTMVQASIGMELGERIRG